VQGGFDRLKPENSYQNRKHHLPTGSCWVTINHPSESETNIKKTAGKLLEELLGSNIY
jgi:hypothetical protein